MYVDHRLDDARPRHDLRRRARRRARSADRALARRHLVGAHVVPPARGAARRRASATIAFDHRGHGQSVLGDGRVTRSRTSAATCKTVLEGLDLRDAVLVGHSMGGVAVQSFVTQFPEIAAERVAGIVLLSTLAYTPFGSRSTRTKARIEQIDEARARHRSGCGTSPNLGFLAARVGFGKNPQPEPRRARAPDDARVPARDAARRAAACSSASTSPRELPERAHPDARRSAGPPTCSRRRPRPGASRELIPGARLELMPRRRAHADARAHRRARPADRRLRARGRSGADARRDVGPTRRCRPCRASRSRAYASGT